MGFALPSGLIFVMDMEFCFFTLDDGDLDGVGWSFSWLSYDVHGFSLHLEAGGWMKPFSLCFDFGVPWISDCIHPIPPTYHRLLLQSHVASCVANE